MMRGFCCYARIVANAAIDLNYNNAFLHWPTRSRWGLEPFSGTRYDLDSNKITGGKK